MAAVSLADELEAKLAMNDGHFDVDDDDSDEDEAPGMGLVQLFRARANAWSHLVLFPTAADGAAPAAAKKKKKKNKKKKKSAGAAAAAAAGGGAADAGLVRYQAVHLVSIVAVQGTWLYHDSFHL